MEIAQQNKTLPVHCNAYSTSIHILTNRCADADPFEVWPVPDDLASAERAAAASSFVTGGSLTIWSTTLCDLLDAACKPRQGPLNLLQAYKCFIRGSVTLVTALREEG